MASRIRGDSKLFEVFIEAQRTINEDGESNTNLNFLYPLVQQDVINSAMKFVFPFDPSFKSISVDCFTFVLTDGDGIFKFGFCRLSTQSNICHCIVSYYPWYGVFYRLLNHFVEIKRSHDLPRLIGWIDLILDIKQFRSGEKIAMNLDPEFEFIVPDPSQLMTIPSSINLTEYFCAVDVNRMMEVFASTLLERRIIVTSKRLSRLTACIHSASSLLFPFHWQHIFIPILPPHLLDYCSAPMPFLIGVHSSLWSKINKDDLGDVLILDADDNAIHSNFNDLDKLPPSVVSKLKKSLGKGKPRCFEGDVIPRAFLRVIVSLFGGYRMAFKIQCEKIVFDEVAFVKLNPVAYQPFLRIALQLQIFHQFIEERLTLMNSNMMIHDLFEEEIKNFDLQETHKKKNSKFADYKIMRFLKKNDKSHFKSFLENLGGCSSTMEAVDSKNVKPQKSQTPTLPKRFLQKFPRKMSANFVADLKRDSSKKLLSSSNSSDGFHHHLEQSILKVSEDMQLLDVGLMDSHQEGDASRGDVDWPEETLYASSLGTFNILSQGNSNNLSGDFEVLFNNLSRSLDNMTYDNINNCGAKNKFPNNENPHKKLKEDDNTSTPDTKEVKPPTADNNKGLLTGVQHLIKLYENKEITSPPSKSKNPVFPGTYIPPHQIPSSIAARQANLQASIEQWKKNYRSRNIAEIQPLSNLATKNKLLQQTSPLCKGVQHSSSENNLSFDSCLRYPLQNSDASSNWQENLEKLNSSEASEAIPPHQNFKRTVSGVGLSRRSAFKANKSQSSTESQRSSIYRKRESIDSRKDFKQLSPPIDHEESDCDDTYSTPPSLPSPSLNNNISLHSSKLNGDKKQSEHKQKCLTLGASNIQCANRYLSDDNLSLNSTSSSYSSFLSADFNEDGKHFTLPSHVVNVSGIYTPIPFQRGKSSNA